MTAKPPEIEVWTVEEFAARVKLPSSTIRDLCARGDIPGARKLGRQWRIPSTALGVLFAVSSGEDEGRRLDAPAPPPSVHGAVEPAPRKGGLDVLRPLERRAARVAGKAR